MSWSDRWAYSMAQGTMTPMTTNRDFDGFIENVAATTQGIPGVGMATNEINDVVGDAQDAWGDGGSGWNQFTNAVEVVTPAFAEDIGTNGLFDNNNTPQPAQAPTPAPTPSAPNNIPNEDGMWGVSMPDPLPVNVSPACPAGYMPNPNPTTRSTRSGPDCVPMDTETPSSSATAGATTPGFDDCCEPIPKEFPPPKGCIPGVAGETHSFFIQQRTACQKEWKTLESMEEEIKSRYEQLCMAREKFNQRRERYGGMCGPYELLYGISEEKEKDALAKAKAKRDCLLKKKCATGGCNTGGCGCANKTSTGCGCGCTGAKTSTPIKTDCEMEFEYEDPLKSACKRAVDESFETAAKKTRVTPARAAKSSCMPCMLKQPPVYRTTILRKPANTVPPPPKAKKTASRKTARAKTVRKVAPKAKRTCR